MKKVAIVIPGLKFGGGVPSMGLFLYQTTLNSGKFKPEFISLATSVADAASVRITDPGSWFRGVTITQDEWRGFQYRHIGAYGSEFEIQRYKPRKVLTELLETYDLIQVVAGGPAIGFAVSTVRKPKCMFVATRVYEERKARLEQLKGIRKSWLRLMTYATARMEMRALTYMDHVFAESDYTRQLIASQMNEAKLSLGIPGIDTALFHPNHEYNANSYILSVGRFVDPRKNVALLLDAYRRVRLANPSAPRLVLAGLDRPSAQDWQLAVDWGITDFIDVYTKVDIAELARLYRNAAMFVLASDEEGLGIVILEAMASGLPVISTRCGGPETAVIDGKTGVLTPVGDASAMAEQIAVLLRSVDVRHKMGEAGRKRAITKFSLTAAGAIYLATYEQLLKQGSVRNYAHSD